MFLSRLIYASRAVDSLQTADVEQILEASRRNNGKVGVSGVLLFSARGFLQCLEGSREAVNQTYARILGDPRHAEVLMLDYREVSRRLFPDWSMQALAPGLLSRQGVLRYPERELFSPTRMGAASALAMLEDIAGDIERRGFAEVSAAREPGSTPAEPLSAAARSHLLAKLRGGSG